MFLLLLLPFFVCACVLSFPPHLTSMGFLVFCNVSIAAICLIKIGVSKQNWPTTQVSVFHDPFSSKTLNTQRTRSALNRFGASSSSGPEKETNIRSVFLMEKVWPWGFCLSRCLEIWLQITLHCQECQTTATALRRQWKYLVLHGWNTFFFFF